MHVKFEPIQRSYIFSQKNADSAGPRNIMKFQHFFKVHQISSNLQNIFESSSETCMWNLSLFREVDLFHRKMLTVPALWIIMKFQHFSKFTKFHQTCRTYLNHHQKHACEIWANSEKLTYFIEKCWQCRHFILSWNFNIFSKFTKFHQTCRTYWNHHQKHACEIWANSEKLTYFTEKCRQCRPFEISWKFNIFSKFTKFHQTCRTYWNQHQKHACEIWAHSEKLTYFIEKCRQCRPFIISCNFNIFSKFTKFHQTCRTYLNHHQKHACEIWANSEKLTYFSEKCRQCRPFEISWNFNIFSKFTKFHQTCRTYWNHHQIMHVKFEPIQRSWLIS